MKSACGVKALDALVTATSDEAGGFSRSGGVATFDVLAGSTGYGGMTRNLSMATLVHMAADNDWALFPMRIPVEVMGCLPLPFILLHKQHFQLVREASISSTRNPGQWLDAIAPEDLPEDLGEYALVISTEPIAQYLISMEDASEFRGSRSFFSKIGAEFKRAARNPYVQLGVGLASGGLGFGAFPAMAFGAYGGAQRGGGVKGALMGGLTGYGSAAAGRGLAAGAGAFSSARAAGATLTEAGGAGVKGFGAGSSSIKIFNQGPGLTPYAGGQQIGLQPAAASEAVKGGTGAAWYELDKAASGAAGAGGAVTSGSFNEMLKGASGKIGLASFLGSALIPSPEYKGPAVDFNTLSEYAARGPQTATGKLVAEEVKKVLGAPYGTAYTAIAEPYARQAQSLLAKNYAEQGRVLDQQYEAAGMLNSGQHQAARQRLAGQEATEVANIHGDVAVKLAAMEGDLRAQFAQIGLQLDQSTMQDLLGITGMQVNQAAAMYGARMEDVQSLRGMLASAGTLFTASALGLTGGGGGALSKLLG